MSNISIKGLPSLDGNLLKPLFEYLLKACPKADEGDDGGDALSHVMFTTDLSVVACDGARWHAVHLPAVEGLLFPEPYAVTRQSLEDFVKLLRAGCSIVGKANRLAVFIDHYPEGEPGLRFIIEREGELWPFTMSRAHFLGPTPRRWVPPVAADARARADESWRKHKAPMAAYWKAVAVYAGHIARVVARAPAPGARAA